MKLTEWQIWKLKDGLKSYGQKALQVMVVWALALTLASCWSKTPEDHRKDLNSAKIELNEKKFEIIKAQKKYPILEKNYKMYYNRGVELDSLLNTNLHAKQAKEYNEQYNEILKHLVEIGLEAVELEKDYLWLKEQANLKETDIAAIEEYLKTVWWSSSWWTWWWTTTPARPSLPNWAFPGLH